jgi:hypothetical protein
MTQFIFNNELKYKLLYVIDIYLDNLCNSKNIYLIKPVFFYNGFNHNNLCLYTQKNLRENVLNYLDNRFNMNTRYLIWEKMYDDVFINNYTGIIKFTDLNNNSSCNILLSMLKEKKEYLSEEALIITELENDYNKL